MSEKLKPVRCGCGGKVVIKYLPRDSKPYLIYCDKCFTASWCYPTEAEAITAWNRAMSGAEPERTAKVVCHGTTMGLSFCCGNCGKPVHSEGKYCHHCGAKLDWCE